MGVVVVVEVEVEVVVEWVCREWCGESERAASERRLVLTPRERAVWWMGRVNERARSARESGSREAMVAVDDGASVWAVARGAASAVRERRESGECCERAASAVVLSRFQWVLVRLRVRVLLRALLLLLFVRDVPPPPHYLANALRPWLGLASNTLFRTSPELTQHRNRFPARIGSARQSDI